MTATIAISFAGNKKKSVKLERYSAKMNGNLRRGLRNAGALLDRALKLKLKPNNPTKMVGRSPHKELRSRKSHLRDSIGHVMGKSASGDFVRVGPNVVYAAIHEFGGLIPVSEKMRKNSVFQVAPGQWRRFAKTTTSIRMPKRAWFFPTFKKNQMKIVKAIRKEINRPLR